MNKPSIPVLIALALMAAIGILLIAAITAGAAPACMTQAQARAKFPKAHLYWHTLHHCWDNQPRQRRTRPSREPDGATARPALAGVRYYPRSFDTVAALDPPVVVNVIDNRWPGSNVIIDAPIVLEPITVVAELEFNEIDAQANQESKP